MTAVRRLLYERRALAVPGQGQDGRETNVGAYAFGLTNFTSTANTRLHYLKRLKRVGLPVDRLAHWYITVIRPVLEYCAVVWHHGLSKYQTESIEAIQRRALRIVHPITASVPYWAPLHSVSFRQTWQTLLCRDFFKKMHDPSSCIHHLLPPARDPDLTSRLRRASVGMLFWAGIRRHVGIRRHPLVICDPRPRNRTNCYKSFIHHALLKFQ